MEQKKICILGATAVGKTSLVQRFLSGIFSRRYPTTSAVRVNRARADFDGDAVQLTLVDLPGADRLSPASLRHLTNAAAIIYVVDGTRLDTLATAMDLKQEVEKRLKPAVPSFLLFNKSDLSSRWEISAEMINEVDTQGALTLLTSAREGSGVNTSFRLICRVLMGKITLVAA